MSDDRYLWPRDGVYYYRRRMPERFASTYGKKMFVQSLDTKSLAEARKRRNLLNVRFDFEFEQIETSEKPGERLVEAPATRLSNEEVNRRVVQYVSDQFAKFERRYINDPADTADQLSEIKIDKEMQLQSLADPGHPDQHRWVQQAFERVFGDEQFDGLTEVGAAEIIRRGLVSLLRKELAFFRDDLVIQPSAPASATPSTDPQDTFGEITRAYLEDERTRATLNKRRRQWIAEVEARLDFLEEVVGKDTPIRSVNYDVAKRLQGILAKLPAHREKRYPGLSFQEAITKGTDDGAPLLSAASQGEYLICFRNVMSVATAKWLVQNNPAEGLRPLKQDLRSAAEKRLPFTVEQVKQLLTCGFYGHWREGAAKRYTKPDRAWRFWLPLIMAFTGMRPGEICQMVVGDIKKSSTGIWYASVLPTADDEGTAVKKVVKTIYSRRSFPIHPTLIALGFLDFVKSRMKDGEDALLFSDLSPSKRGYYSDYPCRRFRESFLDQAISRKPGQTLYSLRHSFRDALRRIEAPSDVLSALGGWSEGTKVSDNYGDKSDPDYLFSYVEKISYPGLELNYRFS
ncbi:site-specific integrase [Mesorhizobium salmacidum]|uniref:Site-specific integrase n=1 Tax=Mesorhizobium salmacidum TaxID=3015171 RepID=A0ABU8KW41_9HYPH